MPVQKDSWHLDRRIPIATIWVMVLQLIGGVWFAAQLHEQIGTLAEDARLRDKRLSQVEAATNAQAINSATLSVELRDVRDGMGDLKVALKEANELLRELGRR